MKYEDGFIETILIDLWNETDMLAITLKQHNTIAVVISSILVVLGIAIIANQIKIRKQLRRIQEQLEQKDKPE